MSSLETEYTMNFAEHKTYTMLFRFVINNFELMEIRWEQMYF